MFTTDDHTDGHTLGDPRRDPALGAWVLTRHADVAAALRDARLAVAGGEGMGAGGAHAAVREAIARALSPERLGALRAGMEDAARRLLAALPDDEPVELVGAFAAPWSLEVAAAATRVPLDEARALAALARELFLAAAHATDVEFPPHARGAAAELARRLARGGGGLDVQSFVALSQTLPAFLAGGWRVLLREPAAAARLCAEPALVPRAVEELLRLGGPSRALFRVASGDVSLGGATIAAGERVVLLLAAANRDPARFPDPDRLDLARGAAGHLAFGRGAHVCPGAPIIRLGATVATGALLTAASALEPAGEPEWLGGFAIRAPATLPVALRRA